MQEKSSFETKQGRTRREKAKRMDPAGISSVKGGCFREEEFLIIEIPMVKSTIKPPLAINKLSQKINLPLNQMVHLMNLRNAPVPFLWAEKSEIKR